MRKVETMIEATTNTDARNAFEKAHAARAQAIATFWNRVFHRTAR